MADNASTNVDIDSGLEEVLEKSIIFQQLVAEMEELKAIRESVELKIAILEAAREKEHISRCK
jgi:rRNA-processing protein FCF1